MAPGTPNRDYTHHAIRILPVNSKLRSIVGDDTFDKVSSWHHQNILSVAGTGLIQTAEYTDQGLSLVEGVKILIANLQLGFNSIRKMTSSKLS